MKTSLRWLLLPAMAAALLSCGGGKLDVAMARKAIESQDVVFAAAFGRADAAGIAALYMEDATLMPPKGDIIKGKQGVEAFWKGGFEAGLKDVTLTTVDVGGSGDTAYEVGKYALKIQPAGQDAMSDAGKYLVIWKRQADGTWKVHVDMWNTSMPLPSQ